MLTIGILHTTIRGDEKLIIEAAKKRNVQIKLIDVREEIFNRTTYKCDFDVALERCVSTVKGTHATRFFESIGVKVINNSSVAAICEDKFVTSLALQKAKVPTPDFAMVFNPTQAIKAIEEMGGFPVVLKPPLGSWGRLLAKVNDIDALEAILEHKDVLGSPQQKSFYIQQYVKKPGRDIRSFVIDGKTICAIYRDSPHWITNTARGGVASNCPVTKEISDISRKASDAVGGGILSMDIFETDDGMQINEINHTTEFKNSEKPTGVSISGAIVDYCIKVAKNL
ncbi:MAG: lysine biosynthesis protein LysX [Patescibacteria group bacterium]